MDVNCYVFDDVKITQSGHLVHILLTEICLKLCLIIFKDLNIKLSFG